jgi:hypothetical protein
LALTVSIAARLTLALAVSICAPASLNQGVLSSVSSRMAVANLLVLFPTAAETIGEALDLGWRVMARCAWGPRDGMKRVRECIYSAELDLPTLVWTRGRDFPLSMLGSRLKCPRCGSLRVRIAFIMPPVENRAAS